MHSVVYPNLSIIFLLDATLLILQNVEIDDFDDFGIDLCPVPQPSFCDSDLDIDKMNCSGSEIKPSTVPRYNCFLSILISLGAQLQLVLRIC